MQIKIYSENQGFAQYVHKLLASFGHLTQRVQFSENIDQYFQVAQPVVLILDLDSATKPLQLMHALGTKAPHIYKLALKARADLEHRLDAYAAGADGFVTQDQLANILPAKLRSIEAGWYQRQTNSGASTAVRFLANRTVKINEHSLSLSFTELKVFKFFWENNYKVISKKEFLNAVWPGVSTAKQNLGNVYLYRLRKRLLRSIGNSVVKTVKGQGYKWDY